MSVKSVLESLKPTGAWRFVTGNQSADLDSVVSAIAYLYFNHHENPKNSLLPLVNIRRDELKLRRDIQLLLELHAILTSSLYFVEDLEKATGDIELVLVDHCNIQGHELWQLFRKGRLSVSGIIDHHEDEGVFLDANPRVVRPTGSCSSLVFNYWFGRLGGVPNVEIVRLLLGPLLIDTSDMTKKVESDDRMAFGAYQYLLVQSQMIQAVEPLALYKTLKQAKKDLSGFSFKDILRKDYKQFDFDTSKGQVKVGFSSLGKSVSWVSKQFPKEEIAACLEEMTKELDIVVITTSYSRKDIFTREFCYYLKSFNDLHKHADSLELDDNVYELPTVPFRVYNQRNTAASRKQVVPVVKQILLSY